MHQQRRNKRERLVNLAITLNLLNPESEFPIFRESFQLASGHPIGNTPFLTKPIRRSVDRYFRVQRGFGRMNQHECEPVVLRFAVSSACEGDVVIVQFNCADVSVVNEYRRSKMNTQTLHCLD